MTTSATVYALLFVHLGIVLVVTAYYALGAALAPGLTRRGGARFARRPWLPAIVGLALSLPWVGAAVVLLGLSPAPLKMAGATLGGLWLLGGLIGGAGIAQHVGRGATGRPATWVDSVRGGLLISLTWILPLVGWLGMLPLTLVTGVGCLALGVLPGESRTAAAAATLAPAT